MISSGTPNDGPRPRTWWVQFPASLALQQEPSVLGVGNRVGGAGRLGGRASRRAKEGEAEGKAIKILKGGGNPSGFFGIPLSCSGSLTQRKRRHPRQRGSVPIQPMMNVLPA